MSSAAATALSEDPKTVTSIKVSVALWKWAKKEAVDTDRSAGDVVEEALRLYRERREGEK